MQACGLTRRLERTIQLLYQRSTRPLTAAQPKRLGHTSRFAVMKPVPASRMRKGLHILAFGWFGLFSILLWVRGRDLLNWAMDAPLSQLLLLQIFNSALSSIIIVELLRTVIGRWERWNQRQHMRAVFYTWGIVFIVSSVMVVYSRLSMQRVLP